MSAPAPRDRWLPRSSGTGQPDLRIGDADREGALAALGEHFAAGRLTHEEYDERASRAIEARTAAEVAPLFDDLPGPHPPVLGGPPVPALPGGVRPAAGGAGRRGAGRVAGGVAGARLPWVPLFLVALGAVLLAGAPAPLLLVLLGMWWFSVSRRWRRARSRWAARGTCRWPGQLHPR